MKKATYTELLTKGTEITYEQVKEYYTYCGMNIIGLPLDRGYEVKTPLTPKQVDETEGLSSGTYNGVTVYINDKCSPVKIEYDTDRYHDEMIVESKHIRRLARFSPEPLYIEGLEVLKDHFNVYYMDEKEWEANKEEYLDLYNLDIDTIELTNEMDAYLRAIKQTHIEYIDSLDTELVEDPVDLVLRVLKYNAASEELATMNVAEEQEKMIREHTDTLDKIVEEEYGALAAKYKSLIPEQNIISRLETLDDMKDTLSEEDYKHSKELLSDTLDMFDRILRIEMIRTFYKNNPKIRTNMISEFARQDDTMLKRYMNNVKKYGWIAFRPKKELATFLDKEIAEYMELFYYSVMRYYVYVKPETSYTEEKVFINQLNSNLHDLLRLDITEPTILERQKTLIQSINAFLVELTEDLN